ncbi:putative small heat shock protein [Methanocella paludicola SANAE]|uniref:Small heat shock protein n=1 Tax=Methanocella paludicola (strain DSM 17711 / JCM 13418 / NBRC 101707 / SANAE) TaxID=304371 RepID=D1Z158_METPS|nr:Hsp20/alpha crystallin family protein [Methanocella paludicola]BAI62430.1 putative small heat shock protein [Methanocella paludicola SANAE]
MAEFTWDIQEELRRIEDRMNRMFGEGQGRRPGWQRNSEVPNVDVQEHGNDVIVTADMPGVDKSDIKINVRNGNILEISAQKRTEMEKREEGFIRHERGYTGYYRSITLPAPVDRSGASARYNNGVLEITLPMTKEATENIIPVS